MNKTCFSFKIVFFCVVLVAVFDSMPAQTKADPAKIAPNEASILRKEIVPLPSSMVRVTLNGSLAETTACQKDSRQGQLRIELSWYNKNDETGKMMLQLVDNKPDFEAQWASHKKEIRHEYEHYKTPGHSLYCSELFEENVPGGRLHMVQYSYTYCDSERDKQYTVDARCFFFNGTTTGVIEIRSQNGVDEIRKMVKHIIQKTADFPFSSLL